MGSPRGAHCGPRSPPRGTICSLSMHHLLVWAVAGATGGGGLRSVCFSSPPLRRRRRRGRELGALLLPEALGQVSRRRRPAITVASAGARRCPSGFAKAPEPPPLEEVAGISRWGREQTHPEGENCDSRVYLELRGPGPGAGNGGRWVPPSASSRELARSTRPCRRSAVQRALQSLGSHNGVSVTGRTSWAPAYHPSHR